MTADPGVEAEAAALRDAAQAAFDADDPAALDLARRLVARTPEDAAAHRLRGLAALADGELDEAATALRSAVRLDPADTEAVVALGHLSHRRGRDPDALELLESAAAQQPGNAGILRNLLDLHRMAGHRRDAVAWAERLVALRPADPLALLDLAELHLALGEHAAARAAFGRLRDAPMGTGRGIVAVHGMVEAEVQAGHLRAALDLAVQATGLDRTPLTTDLLAFLVAAVFGTADADAGREPPTADQVAAALAAERRAYRASLEAAVLDEGEVGG